MLKPTKVAGTANTSRLFIVGAILFLVILFLGGTLVLIIYDFSAQAIEDTILSWGAWGVFASISLMIVHSFVPFPAEFLAVANGMIYGPVWGTIITWVGAMLGAYLAFGLARTIGRPFVEIMVAKKDWHVLDRWVASHSTRFVFFSRFIPVIAFNLINYAAGLMSISWSKFGLATGLGILPVVVILVLFGNYIEFMTWQIWVIFGVCAVVLLIVFHRHYKSTAQNKLIQDTDSVNQSHQ